MQELNSNIQNTLDSGIIQRRFLYEAKFPSGTLYLNDGSRNVYTTDSSDVTTTWIPHDIAFAPYSRTSNNQVDNISVTASTLSGELEATFLAEKYTGKEFNIYAVFFDSGYGTGGYGSGPYGGEIYPMPIADPIEIFSGFMDSAVLDGGKLTLSITSEFINWKKKAVKRRFNQKCQWSFKGSNCGYVGALTTCDKTWADCSKRGRLTSFGGFRFMDEMTEKEIFWGRKS